MEVDEVLKVIDVISIWNCSFVEAVDEERERAGALVREVHGAVAFDVRAIECLLEVVDLADEILVDAKFFALLTNVDGDEFSS